MYVAFELMLLSSEVVREDNTATFLEDVDVLVSHYVLVAVCLIYIPVIISCNFLVFWGILLYPGFHNPSSYLLMNLAIADFLTGCFCLPMYILSYLPYTSDYILANKYACLTWFASIELCAGSSLCSLFFISIDRYIAVMWPLRYTQIVTLPRMIRAIILLWLFVLALAFGPMVFGWHRYDPILRPLTARCNFHRTLSFWYVSISTFGITVSMLLICIVLYTQIIYVSQRQIREFRKRLSTYSRKQIRIFETRISSVQITTCLMLLFILLWLPYMIILPFKHYNLISPNTTEILRVAALLMNFTNAIVNAPIYAMYRVEYRKVYIVMLSRRPCKWKQVLRNLHRNLNSSVYSEDRRMSEVLRHLSPDSDLRAMALTRSKHEDTADKPETREAEMKTSPPVGLGAE